MANQIMLTPEQLREQANQVRMYKNTHSDVMQKMTNLVSSLASEWRGEAQDAYVAKYEGMRSFFVEFEEKMEQYAVTMENTANLLEQTDQQLAARIRNC